MIAFGGTEISKVCLGSNELSKVCLGDTELWSATPDVPVTWESYVQDGLVFQLDGINKGTNQGYWTDLIGNIQFTIPESADLTEETNGFTWTGNVNMTKGTGTIPSGSSCTVEIAMKLTGNANGWGCFANTNSNAEGNIHIARYNARFSLINRVSLIKSSELSTNQLLSLSGNGARACLNKNEVVLDAINYVTPNAAGVGNTSTYGGIRGTIYAIRIYSRQLTLAEMQANQDVDIERFG